MKRLPSIQSDEEGMWLRVPICVEGNSTADNDGTSLYLGDDPDDLVMRLMHVRFAPVSTGQEGDRHLETLLFALQEALRAQRLVRHQESEQRRRENHG